MRNIMIALLALATLHISAQEVIINNTTLLIAEGKYNDAEKYLDSIIRTEPQNVTALMMKGNVLLNYALVQTPGIHFITPMDETIFSPDVSTLKNNIVIIPRATAQKVEQLWRQCLHIDSSRLDIQKGLCSLYGMALMKTELINYLPVMVSASKGKGTNFAYTLVEYARLIHERGDKEGAYAVYKKIAELYPGLSGVTCLIAGVYFEDNDLVHAREYVEKGMSGRMPDLLACHDALDIYTAIGEPGKVLSMLKAAAKDPFYKDYPFYLGVFKYTRHDSTWRAAISTYINLHPDSGAVYAAAQYMLSERFSDDYNGIMGLLNYNLSDFGTKLLTERAMHDYQDSTAPYVIAIQVLINDKNYTKANELLVTLMQKAPGAKDLLYYYAYSLYCAGDYKTSLSKWAQYAATAKKAKATDPERDTFLAAPYYFIGQCYRKSGVKAKATEYFKMIISGKDESKYAYMAKVQLDNMK